jgi:outer membrane protein OmpA-like peptidoglycan-associated protein
MSACAAPPPRNDLVVVIPDSEDGHIGAVVVEAAGNKTVLDKAYAAAGAGAVPNTVAPVPADAQAVDRIFGTALAAQPIPPKSYTLYFFSDSDRLVPDSKAAFEAVFAEIARRKAAEIVVTGHTDTLGDPAYNDKLSLDRAKAVSKLFIQRGLPPESVLAVGRGQRELLIPTKDQVSESRNRRVVITVR